MTVDQEQLNNALIEYLGGGREPGVIPNGQEARLRAAFPQHSDELLAECKKVIDLLDCDEEVFQTGDLAEIARSASERIRKRFDWLDTLTAHKLGNYYSYLLR